MDRGSALEDIADMRAALARLAGRSIDTLTHPEQLTALDEIESLTRQLPGQTQRITSRLTAETTPYELGAKSWRDVLTARLRISRSDARRRLGDTEHLGPRTSMTGEPLEPLLAATAAAQAEGAIGAEHVRIVRATMDALPSWVDVTTRAQAERDLVGAARGLDPDTLRKVADRLLALIDQDGPMPDDAERARRRGVWFGKQGRDGMTPIKGWLDPQALATWEPILAKLAAPGMCNPDDEQPRTSGTPSAEQIEADTRSVGQRNHDALIAIGRSALASGELGQHNGVQTTIIATTTLQDLQRAAGVAVTGGGSLLPMSYLIRMASHAYHYLAIFDECTWEPLHLGRAKRIASHAQRIMLHSRDVGCTFPGCTVPGYGTQVHHINGWAKHHGLTNIDVEVLACKGHNLMAEQGWTVEIRNGVVVWIPPPELDTGQTRTNDYHHPDRILKPPDEDDPPMREEVDT